MTTLTIASAYAFVPIRAAALPGLQAELLAFGAEHGLQGHTLLAEEGINGTVAGSAEGIAAWRALLEAKFGPIDFKLSTAEKTAFRRFTVKIKPEIVGLKKPELVPVDRARHLSPEDWQQTLEREDVILVDARNDYEQKIGTFRGALPTTINAFHDFPAYVAEAAIPKDKKVLMYCTGGIRCEKALLEMQAQGYQDVWQLDGGILAYLEQFPEKNFEGECFVFDHRVAVDQHLAPTATYELCPHCGYAGDVPVTCACGRAKKICATCSQEEPKRTCSTRCANLMKKIPV